jgi:hypothetical protein
MLISIAEAERAFAVGIKLEVCTVEVPAQTVGSSLALWAKHRRYQDLFTKETIVEIQDKTFKL